MEFVQKLGSPEGAKMATIGIVWEESRALKSLAPMCTAVTNSGHSISRTAPSSVAKVKARWFGVCSKCHS